MAAPPPSTAAPTTDEARNDRAYNYDDDPYLTTVESLTRVAVSGFGGYLVGLSLARRGAARQAASAFSRVPRASEAAAATRNAGSSRGGGGATASDKAGGSSKRLPRQRVVRSTPPTTGPYVDQELPHTWAVAVTTFAGILEFMRMTSPTSLLWELARGQSEPEDGDNDELDSEGAPSSQPIESDGHSLFNNESLDPSITTISDLVIGGSVAGALFKGSAVRTRVGARLDASLMGISPSSAPSNYLSAVKGKPLSGLLPGAALGLLAGVATVAVDRAQVAVEEYFGRADGDEMVETAIDDGASIPADIKAMSNEELMRSIEILKSSKSESNDDEGEGTRAEGSSNVLSRPLVQTPGVGNIETDRPEQKEMHDLISLLGFRPHPSQ